MSLPPAVVAALKAADEMADFRITRHYIRDVEWRCSDCSAGIGKTRIATPHLRDCPVGRYLAARKEIKDV